MDEAIRTFVRKRASGRCEYCTLHEDDDAFTFHVEHVVAKKHGGIDDERNLAFACQHCNLHKGTNLSGIDPDTSQIAQLFNPREDKWHMHFRMNGPQVEGLTPTGRATIEVLAINDADRIRAHALLGYGETRG